MASDPEDLIQSSLPYDLVDFSDVPVLSAEDFPEVADVVPEADKNGDQTGGKSL